MMLFFDRAHLELENSGLTKYGSVHKINESTTCKIDVIFCCPQSPMSLVKLTINRLYFM